MDILLKTDVVLIALPFCMLLQTQLKRLKQLSGAACRRFAHLLIKKDVACPETKKDLLRKVKSAISTTAERFSGNMQNVRCLCRLNISEQVQ